jgi:subtilase family serine protease
VTTAVSGPASVEAGQNITVSATVKNQGTATVQTSFVGYYLSTDAVITTADQYLSASSVSGLAAGAQQTVSRTITIPTGQAPGTYYIGAIADYSNVAQETNETNNALAGNTITIQ